MRGSQCLTPFSQYAEFHAEYALSKELPYWDFFEMKDPACFALSDGSLVQGLKLHGAAIETWDADRINRFTKDLRAFLNALPDGVDLQFFLDVDSNYSDLIAEHERLGSPPPLVQWLTSGRTATLNATSRSGALRRIRLYLFAYLRMDSVKASPLWFFSRPKLFVQQRREIFERRARELSQLCLSLRSQLNRIGVGADDLSTNDSLELIYRILNPLRSQSMPCPVMQTEHRRQDFTREELSTKPDLALPSPREQLALSDVIQGVDSFFLDGYYHRIVTLKTLPELTHSALVSRLMTLPFNYMLSLQLRVPEQSAELAALQIKRRMAHSMSLSHQGQVTDLESEAKLQSTEDLIREIIQTGQKIFSFQLAVLLKDKSKEDLEFRTKATLARFRELNGTEGMAETVAGFKAFKTALPGGNTTMVRAKRVKTDNLADFLPLYRPSKGDKRPVCLLHNREGGLFAYDPYDKNLPNYNALVTGSSGSGKSFLSNCILLQYLADRPLIYVIDIGGSYRKLCEFVGGQYIEIAPSEDSKADQSVSVNPFLLAAGEERPSPRKIKFLMALLETILTDKGGDKLPKLDRSLIEEAIIQTYERCKGGVPTLSDIATTFSAAAEPALRDYARMLYPWTGLRPYGRLLDSSRGLSLNAEMVVFDLKGLSSYPDLQSAMILIITDFLMSKLESAPGRPKRILMDECWELLKSHGATSFMEYCARTLRKSGSGITFITQGLEEIARSPIGPSIISNTATKFVLSQRGDLALIQSTLKLNDQEMALIASLHQEKGDYSEAFLIANERRAVIRLIPTAVEYWLATSDAADNALLANARSKFPETSLSEIIYMLAVQFPNGSQGATEFSRSVPSERANCE